MVEILDSTLREGEQTPGVKFTTEQKLDIALMLDEFGVDYIEAGHPVVSDEIMHAVKDIVAQKLDAQVLGHARAVKEDIDAVVESGAGWVGIFLGVNDLSLQNKVHCTLEQAIGRIADTIDYSKAHGLKVRYTPEDATRTEWNTLVKASRAAVEAGADRVSIADTVGVMTPKRMEELVKKLKAAVKVPLHVHCHNDFGLAVANALAAYEAGAAVIDVTVNGLGERSGITPLHKLCAVLNHLYGEGDWGLTQLPAISERVSEYSGIPLDPRMPLVGRHAFAHKADLHVKAVLKNPECYEAVNPGKLGLKRTIMYA
jgi:2-isopropylmalate synthase